eukprot:3557950-Amphidinium_carterae.1
MHNCGGLAPNPKPVLSRRSKLPEPTLLLSSLEVALCPRWYIRTFKLCMGLAARGQQGVLGGSSPGARTPMGRVVASFP